MSIEKTINNIQKIIDIIEKEQFYTIKDISEKSGITYSIVSKNLRRISENVVSKNPYTINCKKAEETEYIKRISNAIIILLENEKMMFFQEKYLQVILKMTNSEVKAAITYTKDILRTQKNI